MLKTAIWLGAFTTGNDLCIRVHLSASRAAMA